MTNCNDRFGPARLGGLRFSVADATMETFAARLESRVVRHVVDRTNLTGKFDADVEYTTATAPSADPSAAAPDALSIFTALQEQLGLKLQATTGPVEVLMIDHAERPVENAAQVAVPIAPPKPEAVVQRVRAAQPLPRPQPQPAPVGTIAGTVKDSFLGDPLEGVSVEIESDVANEKPRTVVTDADGSFRVGGLPPGIYIVTLTHMEFVTFKREGLRVVANQTSRVDAAMREGGGLRD
jgi:hypothetical protein